MTTTLTFLGHTGILLQSGTSQILIDPNFSQRLGWLKRRDEPVFDPETIKKTRAVLLTSAHPNRMDIASYKYLPLSTHIFLPRGTRSVLSRFIDFTYEEVSDGDEKNVGDFRITAVASPHRAQRWSGLRFILALNYVIQTPDNKVIFYGTDSPYGPHFAEFADRFKLDVAILPIDHVGPDFIAGKRYLDIPGALKAFTDLRATTLIPNAYGAFSFSGRKLDVLLEELRSEMFKRNLKDSVRVMTPGDAMDLI